MDIVKETKMKNYYIKTIIIGDNKVGKTSLLKGYCGSSYQTTEDSNNNMELRQRQSEKPVNYTINRFSGVVQRSLNRQHGIVNLNILDTAGQERYRSLTASYYRGAHGCLILYDVTKPETFDHVNSWYHDLNTYSQNPDRISTILVGTKCLSPNRQIPKEKAEKFAEHLGIPYMEVSSENGQNVTKVFEKLADMIIENFQKHPSLLIETLKSTKLTQPDIKKKIWCSC